MKLIAYTGKVEATNNSYGQACVVTRQTGFIAELTADEVAMILGYANSSQVGHHPRCPELCVGMEIDVRKQYEAANSDRALAAATRALLACATGTGVSK